MGVGLLDSTIPWASQRKILTMALGEEPSFARSAWRGSRLQPLVLHAAVGGTAQTNGDLYGSVHSPSTTYAFEDLLRSGEDGQVSGAGERNRTSNLRFTKLSQTNLTRPTTSYPVAPRT